MNTILYLSCVVFIIGSLVWTARAQAGDDFESERARFLDNYANPSVDKHKKMNAITMDVPSALNFLKKYAGQIEMTPTQRSLAYHYLEAYENHLAEPELQDMGISPPQMCWWSYFYRTISLKLMTDIASNEVKRAIKTE